MVRGLSGAHRGGTGLLWGSALHPAARVPRDTPTRGSGLTPRRPLCICTRKAWPLAARGDREGVTCSATTSDKHPCSPTPPSCNKAFLGPPPPRVAMSPCPRVPGLRAFLPGMGPAVFTLRGQGRLSQMPLLAAAWAARGGGREALALPALPGVSRAEHGGFSGRSQPFSERPGWA